MKKRLLAIRKAIENHVFFNYTENEKVFVINTDIAMVEMDAKG